MLHSNTFLTLTKFCDRATSDEANRPIICEYEPDALWLWTKWRGTALSITYVPVIVSMALGVAVDRFVHFNCESTWALVSMGLREQMSQAITSIQN